MATPITVLSSAAQIGEVVAEQILDRLAAADRYVVGFPAGRSATPVAAALGRLALQRGVRVDGLQVVMMDEYVTGQAGQWELLSPSTPHSCIGWAQRNLLGPLGLRPDSLIAPDPNEPGALEQEVLALGGIDLFLLASGQGDGHVALNGPGTPRDAPTRVVKLPESTRRDNLSTFPHLRSPADVPTYGVTIGTAELAELSHSVAMLLWGPNKAYAFDRVRQADSYDPMWPATIVHDCRNALIYADEEAAPKSEREGVS
ncbi:6-phosphogluconolactonase [Kribbella sp. NBC_01510]|uniref:6-phosphogluconolactonase n=1 Tax=Kribbella sp. NBC_01510 TaxID=2903581 RepID=UPI003863C5FB